MNVISKHVGIDYLLMGWHGISIQWINSIQLRPLLRDANDNFPDFFHMDTFIESTHMKL